MKNNELIKRAGKLADHYRVTNGEKFRLKDVDPGDTLDFDSDDKDRAKEALASGVELLAKLQDKLYAQDRWGVLLIFQSDCFVSQLEKLSWWRLIKTMYFIPACRAIDTQRAASKSTGLNTRSSRR